MKRFLKPLSLVALLGVGFVAGWVRLPYYALGPGEAREVEPLIHVEGHSLYQSTGKLVMTTVAFEPATALVALIAWLDPHQYVVPRDALFAPGQTSAQERERSLSEMDTSKLDAAYVVLRQLAGYPKDHDPGTLVERVLPGCPAEGALFAGDLILAIDGTTVRSRGQALSLLDADRAEGSVTFRVRAGGETEDVTVDRRPCANSSRPLVGITLIPNFPIGVTIESDDVGGPSAGLMWALGLYDLLTPGDLTTGRVVAGTGTIGLRGRVGAIGGISDKVVAAERAGADVFLCPEGNANEARTASDGSMDIVSVASFRDAIDALHGP